MQGDFNYLGQNKSQDNINDINSGRKSEMFQERKTIGTWDREILEDKYLRLMEDHLVLKKYAREQENKMKLLGTKLRKLTDDPKKSEINKGSAPIAALREERDIMRSKISELDSQNKILKNKLKIAQSQVNTTSRRLNISTNNSTARIDTGVPKSRNQNMRSILPHGENAMLQPRHRGDDFSQNDVDSILNSPKNMAIVDKLNTKRDEYLVEDKGNYRNEMAMINLRREINDKEDKLKEVMVRFDQLNGKQRELEEANYNLSHELDLYKNGAMGSGAKIGYEGGYLEDGANLNVMRKRIADLELINRNKDKEIQLLKQTNEDLTNKAFDIERERDWREKELRYRTRITQLEKAMKMDMGEKGGILDDYQREREKFDKLESEMAAIRLRNFELQGKLEEQNRQLKMYTKDVSATPEEIQEALIIIQQKRHLTPSDSMPNLYKKTDTSRDQDLPKRLDSELARHAETILELEKTRNILSTERKLRDDYKLEADRKNKRLEEVTADYEARLSDYAKLLDIRSARIRKLESQLKDIGYGTRGGVRTEGIEEISTEIDPMLLERGENVIEIHIGKVNLTQRAIQTIGDSDPLLFGTWEFLHFEIQATGILRGTAPDFDMTAEYIVKIDEFLLECLYKKSFTFELHQAIGSEYETLAVGQINCRDLIDESHEKKSGQSLANSSRRFNCTSRLISITSGGQSETNENGGPIDGEVYGVLEYWIKLRHPMDHVIRQYNEKLKAQNYIDSNKRTEKQQTIAQKQQKQPYKDTRADNYLLIRILRCRGLNLAQQKNRNVQPTPYAVYMFHDSQAHMTQTITATNNPEFHDEMSYPVEYGNDLDRYLKSQNLEVVIIDENESSNQTSDCLGIARIPLISLSQDKKITGTFELFDKQNRMIQGASMDVELEWKHKYVYGMPIDNESHPEKDYNRPVIQKRSPSPQLSPRTHKDDQMGSHKQPQHERAYSPNNLIQTTNQPDKHDRKGISTIKSPDHDHPSMSQRESSPIVSPTREKKDYQKERTDDHPAAGLISPPAEERYVQEKPKKKQRKNISKSINEVSDLLESTDVPISSKIDSPAESVNEEMTEQVIKSSQDNRSKSPEQSTSAIDNVDTAPSSEISQVPVPSTSKKRSQKSTKNKASDSFKLEIDSIELTEDVSDIFNLGIKTVKSKTNLCVSVIIQGISQDDTEVPAIPIPPGFPKLIQLGFKKNFEKIQEKQKQVFGAMLLNMMPDKIELIVALEPEDEDEDLYDIAKTTIHLKSILDNERNIVKENIPIFHFSKENKQVGHIVLTLEMLDLLRSISKRI